MDCAENTGTARLFVASFLSDGSGGIRAYEVTTTGAVSPRGEVLEIPGVLALALHPSGVLYAASAEGTIFAFEPRKDFLRPLCARPSGGDLPCSLAVDPSGRYLLTAHYDSGSIAVHRLAGDGSIGQPHVRVFHDGSGPVIDRQEASHLHHVSFESRTGNLLVTDLGGDALYIYAFETENGTLTKLGEARTPPGTGPRSLAVVDGTHVIVTDELSSTVSWYRYSAQGRELSWKGTAPSSRAGNGTINFPGEIVADTERRTVYVANRGHDTIAVFKWEADELVLVAEVPCPGRWPQHLALHKGHLYCALQEDDALVQLELCDAVPVPGEAKTLAHLPRPSWVLAT